MLQQSTPAADASTTGLWVRCYTVCYFGYSVVLAAAALREFDADYQAPRTYGIRTLVFVVHRSGSIGVVM